MPPSPSDEERSPKRQKHLADATRARDENRARAAVRRKLQTPEQLRIALNNASSRARAARARESPQKREARLAKNRLRMREARARRSTDEARACQQQNSQARREARSIQTPEPTSRRQEYADRNETVLSRRRFPSLDVRAVDFGEMDIECKNCGALHFLAERKVGSSRTNPAFSNCCQGGKLTNENIPLLRDPPQFLRELLTQSTSVARGFR